MYQGWTTTFFRKGGRVEHALEYLLTTAAEGAAEYYEAQVLPEVRVSRLFGLLVVTPCSRMPQLPRRLAHQSDEDYNFICQIATTQYNSWVGDLLEDAAYTALPACENDLNLALVALKLGLANPERFLPPPPRPRDSDDREDVEEDAEDEEEDEEEEDEEEDEEGYGDEEDEEEDVDDEIDEESGESEKEDDEVAHEEPSPKRMRMYL